MTWQIIQSPKASGATNMATDLKLFQNLEKGLVPPTVRFYGWSPPCVSLGYSQDPEKLLNLEECRELGWDWVKRPTGGGIVFHNTEEITCSIVGPIGKKSLMETYLFISEIIVVALKKLGINAEIRKGERGEGKGERPAPQPACPPLASPSGDDRRAAGLAGGEKGKLCFAEALDYEITMDGKKLVGSAQRRGRKAFLQQGSIQVRPSFYEMKSILNGSFDEEYFKSQAAFLGEKLKSTDLEKLPEILAKEFQRLL